MKNKHPIRICIEVLAVLLLAFGLVRFYVLGGDEDANESDAASRGVSRVMKSRAESGSSRDGRVFGKEPERAPLEMVEAEDDLDIMAEMEPSILTLNVVYADTGETVDQPVDLISEDCGWRQSYPQGLIKLIIEPGTCSYRIESSSNATVKLASDTVTIEVEPGQTITHEITVEAEAPAEELGGISLDWVRGTEWIEIASVVPGSTLALAGLQAGDIILEINGVSVNGLDDDALVESLLGPIGEPVLFVLAVAEGESWDELEVKVERQALSF